MSRWTHEQQAEHRRIWVAALRSGKYEQGKDNLREGSRFCCLGVGCEVSGLGHWDGSVFVTEDGDEVGDLSGIAVRSWLGIAHQSGLFEAADGKVNSLAELNDDGVPFEKIAQIIESEPKGLLT